MVTLRAATEDDRELAFAILRESMRPSIEATWGAWNEELQRERFSGDFEVAAHRLIEDETGAVGLIAVYEHEDRVFLARLFIVPGAQGRGIGTQLVRELLQAAHGRGVPVILTTLKRSRAHPLYARLGFRIVGETETHFRMEAHP